MEWSASQDHRDASSKYGALGKAMACGSQLCSNGKDTKEQAVTLEHMSPIFASGRVSARSFFLLITLYSHHNPAVMEFVSELTRCDEARLGTYRRTTPGGGQGETYYDEASGGYSGSNGGNQQDNVESYMEDHASHDEWWFAQGGSDGFRRPKPLRQMVNETRSVLDQILVPMNYIGHPYSILVCALMEMGIVPIGLYRPAGVDGAPLPFTLINPDKETKLTSQDQVFILRPKSLL